LENLALKALESVFQAFAVVELNVGHGKFTSILRE
jgi:hypothetical protein